MEKSEINRFKNRSYPIDSASESKSKPYLLETTGALIELAGFSMASLPFIKTFLGEILFMPNPRVIPSYKIYKRITLLWLRDELGVTDLVGDQEDWYLCDSYTFTYNTIPFEVFFTKRSAVLMNLNCSDAKRISLNAPLEVSMRMNDPVNGILQPTFDSQNIITLKYYSYLLMILFYEPMFWPHERIPIPMPPRE